MTRIQAADLRSAARKAAAARADGADQVLLDIEVLIDSDAVSALRRAGDSDSSAGLRYVGNARGLAGLIADVQRLGIADGVVLVTPDEAHVSRLMLNELAPGLATAG